ncbi:MAG TPA: aspartyl protease family protein [Candidatus Angelobacter sp.]|nr:aspartyl protease family protein [Candidatus Angelobacter sp.]
MSRLLLGLVLLVSIAGWAEEIPLDNCRQLPIVKANIEKRQFQFLLDTGAAVTLLNTKTFSSSETTEIIMQSWNGTVGAPAREVVLREFSIGDHTLFNLKLLAVDLTSVERSCQKRVDGVLGADLIAKLGLTIDLKNHVASLDAGGRSPAERFTQLDHHVAACAEAFNRSDDKTFEKCLDPDIVLLTSKGDFHGRREVMQHFKSYFGQDPPVLVSLTPRGRHAIGNVIWIEYDMVVTVGDQSMKHRCTAIYQKTGERWLMSNMNYLLDEGMK